MFKSLLLSAMVLAGAHSSADTVQVQSLMRSLAITPQLTAINWTIGDSVDYNLKGGIMNGTMHMFVREATTQGYWLQQDLKLGFLGEHKIETHIDKNTGQVLEILMDGQKQDIPEAGEQEVVDSRKENVTVPKGTFEAFWVKLLDKKANTNSEIWINPTIVPIMGMIKSIQPSQMGTVTLELTDFKRN